MAQETLTQARANFQQIAAPFQSNEIVPDTDLIVTSGEHTPVTAAYGMPADLPLPLGPESGVFTPATGVESDIADYDPWQSIVVQKNYDWSRPLADTYGEPIHHKAHSFVAEWGGMPYPVRDYQDMISAVLYSPRHQRDVSGPVGQYMGAQNTAWEYGAGNPQTDYWSTIILGAGG
jgi:hypothetical protein